MARKGNSIETRQPRTIVVGAGITEYWYLKHLKKMHGFNYILKPSLFGDESMQTIRNRISEGIDSGATVICVFDEDVSQWNEAEKKRMDDIHHKYENHEKVIIASSMPSIEYWLLLHFENTNRYFGTSSKVIEVLKKHLPGFDKKESFLKQERWMAILNGKSNIVEAYNRAKKFGHSGESYTDVWKGIDKFKEK